MVNIEWKQSFELGHPRIDAEHRIFLDLIQAISRFEAEHASPERVAGTILELLKYAEFHFVSEENLMQDVGYPDIESHRQEHRILLARLADNIAEARAGHKNMEEMAGFLYDWFSHHTLHVDMQLIRYLRNRTASG